jgi:hypothetical protein
MVPLGALLRRGPPNMTARQAIEAFKDGGVAADAVPPSGYRSGYHVARVIRGVASTADYLSAMVSHPGFRAVPIPWFSGRGKETVDHGQSTEVLQRVTPSCCR